MVKVVGGLAQALNTNEVVVESDELTVRELILFLESKRLCGDAIKPSNLLVMVNGVEASALEGSSTLVRAGDKVVALPVTHGG